MAEHCNKSPADQASPVNGVVPPVEHRWKPGQSGNPAGRPSAGSSLREWMNSLASCDEDELESIAEDRKEPAVKRSAARQWLLAISNERTKVGTPICGEAVDRIADRTDGKPTQAVIVEGAVPTAVSIETPMSRRKRAVVDQAGGGQADGSGRDAND